MRPVNYRREICGQEMLGAWAERCRAPFAVQLNRAFTGWLGQRKLEQKFFAVWVHGWLSLPALALELIAASSCRSWRASAGRPAFS